MRGVLGSGKRDVHEIEMLGRSLTWTEEGLEYEGSDKNRQALLEGLGLNEESKAVNSAAVKPEEIGQEEDTEMFDASETKRFRCLAATLNHMSSDRSNVQYAAKEVCTRMANSTRGSWKRFEKSRQILERSRESDMEDGAWRHIEEVNVDVHVDSNWASGPKRKSTSGGMMMINGTVVKHWSRTQATRALSTAEAEYYAVVTGAAEGLGMQSMMADLGVATQVRGVLSVAFSIALKNYMCGLPLSTSGFFPPCGCRACLRLVSLLRCRSRFGGAPCSTWKPLYQSAGTRAEK